MEDDCDNWDCKPSEEGPVAFNTFFKDSLMLLDLKNDSPVVLISEVSSFKLSPIMPVVMSALLGIDVLKLDVVVLSLEVADDLWLDQVEMALNITGYFHLFEDFFGVGVWTAAMLVMVMLVVMLVAHLIFNYSSLSKIRIFISYRLLSGNFEFQRF